jgi:hypothetical protein
MMTELTIVAAGKKYSIKTDVAVQYTVVVFREVFSDH